MSAPRPPTWQKYLDAEPREGYDHLEHMVDSDPLALRDYARHLEARTLRLSPEALDTLDALFDLAYESWDHMDRVNALEAELNGLDRG